MTPVVPIVPGHELSVTELAKDQEEYFTLPVHRSADGVCLSRWRLNWRERLRVLLSGDIYFYQHTFGHAVQPVSMQTETPEVRYENEH